MCIQNSPDEESQKTYWCWTCDKTVSAKDYAVHDRLNHDLEEETCEEENDEVIEKSC